MSKPVWNLEICCQLNKKPAYYGTRVFLLWMVMKNYLFGFAPGLGFEVPVGVDPVFG